MIAQIKNFFKETDLATKEQKKAVKPVVLDLLEDSDFQDSVSVKEFDFDDTVPMELEQLFKK